MCQTGNLYLLLLFLFICSRLQAMMTTSEPLLLRTGVKKEEIDVQHHHHNHHHHQQQQQLQHHSHFCSMDDECSPADSSLYSPTTTALQLEVTRFSLYSRLLSSTEQQQQQQQQENRTWIGVVAILFSFEIDKNRPTFGHTIER